MSHHNSPVTLNCWFPLIPLPRRVAIRENSDFAKNGAMGVFPLIPLPRRVAIVLTGFIPAMCLIDVSINSTTPKGSNLKSIKDYPTALKELQVSINSTTPKGSNQLLTIYPPKIKIKCFH